MILDSKKVYQDGTENSCVFYLSLPKVIILWNHDILAELGNEYSKQETNLTLFFCFVLFCVVLLLLFGQMDWTIISLLEMTGPLNQCSYIISTSKFTG